MDKKVKKFKYKDILQNEEVKAFLKKGNENLGMLGYTDHSKEHCAIVAKRAGMILSKLGYSEHEIELAEIAGAMHDRVNYAVTNSTVKVNPQKHLITLNLQIDEEICTMYEYFEIFLGRMMMCRRAAELLGTRFKLTANGNKVL